MISTLATQADDQRRAYIRALAQIGQHVGHALEVKRQLAAALMMEIADRTLHLTADRLSDVVCADNARDNGNQIAGSEFTVCPPVALERIAAHH